MRKKTSPTRIGNSSLKVVYGLILFSVLTMKQALPSSEGNILLSQETEGGHPQGSIRVLSIDGGGTRGIIPAVILEALEKKTGKRVSDLFDVIVGTSTGGLSALYLTTPDKQGKAKYTASELVSFFEEQSQKIHTTSWWDSLTTCFGYRGPRYSEENKKSVLDDSFGRSRFSDTSSLCKVIVPGHDLERNKTVFFRNTDAADDKANDYKLSDLVEAITSTPTYFQPAKLENFVGEEKSLIDANILLNNPTLLAVTKAREFFPESTKMTVVSLGTGKEIAYGSHSSYAGAGSWAWGQTIVPLVARGTANLVDQQVSDLLSLNGSHYYRIETELLSEDMRIDQADATHMKDLKIRAQATLDKNQGTLERMIEELLPPQKTETILKKEAA